MTDGPRICLQQLGLPRGGEGAPDVIAAQYKQEAAALDGELLAVIDAWRKQGAAMSDAAFNSLAVRIFAHQLRYNVPYARFCASLGVTLGALPSSWEQIPAVPVTAFKDASLTTFDPRNAKLRFETSGTTQNRSGTHFMETAALYEAALLAGFEGAMLRDRARLRYFNVLPQHADNLRSSLAYMVAAVARTFGDGHAGWYVRGDQLQVEAFVADLRSAIAQHVAVCITGTAFALLNLIDALAARREFLRLPLGSRVMETGGFKGRTRTLERAELYRLLATRFGIEEAAIVAEYGMTELTTQCYDSFESRRGPQRIKESPPWMRSRVVDAAGQTLRAAESGTLVHLDLANRSSVLAVWTDDLASQTAAGFVLLGRAGAAPLRGCSLDAEELRT